MNGIFTKENIKNMIYEIRGKKVMLASDLARVFECKNGTKDINKTVNRNKNKFSNNSYFQLTKEEYLNLRLQSDALRFQNGTLNNDQNGRGQHPKYLPYVFTSEGIKVIFSILKSEKVKVISEVILDVFNEEESYEIIKKVPEIQGKNIRILGENK